jgi:hypothetical protein
MKEMLEPPRVVSSDNNRLLATSTARPRPSCLAPPSPKNLSAPGEYVRPISVGAVWMFLVILLLTIATAGYLFWAKLNTAWPFAF